MRALMLMATLLVVVTSSAETLRQVLKANGIPERAFSNAELDGNVNAAAAVTQGRVFVAYVRLDSKNLFTGNPQLVEFDPRSATILRADAEPQDTDLCCGSPESINFVDDFAILSFHINPSAETMLVIGKDLKVVVTLYGFDAHQVGPGQIVFIEDMIHFAPQHPERLRFADLHTGKTEEVYPIKNDELRTEFAEIHRKHMPSEQECRQNNDPCKPSIFDETIEFLPSNETGAFRVRVTREGTHPRVTKSEADMPFEQADYSFTRRENLWYYCSRELTTARLVSGAEPTVPSPATESCSPNLPVVADTDAGQPSPFATIEKRDK